MSRWAEAFQAAIASEADIVDAMDTVEPNPFPAGHSVHKVSSVTPGKDSRGGCAAGPAMAHWVHSALREARAWSYPLTLPGAADWCACCKGHCFWTRASNPGWRCWTCHPPVPGWTDVRKLRT